MALSNFLPRWLKRNNFKIKLYSIHACVEKSLHSCAKVFITLIIRIYKYIHSLKASSLLELNRA